MDFNDESHGARPIRRREFLGSAAATVAALPFAACSEKQASGGTKSGHEESNSEALVVGGLPVTCNLTLPVACVAQGREQPHGKSGAPQFAFEYSKYSGWPEIKESLMAGRIQAAYMLAPLVMDLPTRGSR